MIFIENIVTVMKLQSFNFELENKLYHGLNK